MTAPPPRTLAEVERDIAAAAAGERSCWGAWVAAQDHVRRLLEEKAKVLAAPPPAGG